MEQAFARIEGSWENLLQSARDCDESVVFIAISELVEITEDATDNALFKSEDLLRAIGHHGVTSEVHGMDTYETWDPAVPHRKNGLVFTELDTLMTVAREAIGQVGTSARLTEAT